MRTILTIALSDPFGGLGRLVSGMKAQTSLTRIASGICLLHSALGGPTARSARASPHDFDLRRTATQVVSKAPIDLPDRLRPESLLAQVELAMAPDIIASKTPGPQRDALIMINNALAGTSLIATISLGDATVCLERPMRAAPLQRGVPWHGCLVGGLECRHFRKRRVDLSPLDMTEAGCQLVVVSTQAHEPFFESLSRENAARPIYVAGDGTFNGTFLRIPSPSEVRFATLDETAASMALAQR